MLANGGTVDGAAPPRPQDPRADAQQPPPARAAADRDPRPADAGDGLRARLAGAARRGRRPAGTGSVGEYGWAGAAKTYYWVDPAEELVGVFMTQYMTGVLLPDRDFRSLTYQAIID